ncbi:MAG TPA: ABC transporter ATP-binding protein [Actinomycetota bacterium]|nr:ABC transporter ATP-binding protein [Actinomycetota bacterium]
MSLLEVKGMMKHFGGVKAVDGVDFTANEGEILAIIGPNGAGKTTVFNILTGFYTPDEGTMTFDGNSLVGLLPNQVTALGISRTFQAVRLFANMTVLENAMVGQHCRTRWGILGAVVGLPAERKEEKIIEEKARECLRFFGKRLTGPREDELASALSYADRRRLEIARAMATEPRLLLLDEPAAGFTPKEKEEIVELIGRLRDERGYAIIIIEHDMPVVKNVSDRVIALDYGKKIAEGTYNEVASNERVIEAYLGARHKETA